jgi:hypothetical protein
MSFDLNVDLYVNAALLIRVADQTTTPSIDASAERRVEFFGLLPLWAELRREAPYFSASAWKG